MERPGPDTNTKALKETNLPWDFKKEIGKVRDIYNLEDGRLLIIATDRLSAFDKQVGVVAGRGQVLNQLSAFWFEKTRDIIPNHMIEVIDPNVMVVKEYSRINLEMVVRGYLTGSTDTSIWMRYLGGERNFGGIVLPDGMKKNQSLLHPILDPTTKATVGHDKAIMKRQIIASGIVTEAEYNYIEKVALQLFARGEDIARRAELILVDTKYEFGKDENGNIVLIDEIHTPDSSRFWNYETYEERLSKGDNPDIYDKEFVRLWFTTNGYNGNGDSPQIPEEILNELMNRYVYAYENLTHTKFEVANEDVHNRITRNVENWLKNNHKAA